MLGGFVGVSGVQGRWLLLVFALSFSGVSSLATGAETSPVPKGPTLITNISEWFGPDNYPRDAMRAEQQGRVVVALSIDVRGHPISCAIDVTSGVASLDNATCDIAMRHAVFSAANDERGRPIVSTYRLAVRWVLPDNNGLFVTDLSDNKLATKDVDVEVHVDRMGIVTSCKPLSTIDPHAANPCTTFPIGMQTARRFLLNGQSVGATIVQHSSERVTPEP